MDNDEKNAGNNRPRAIIPKSEFVERLQKAPPAPINSTEERIISVGEARQLDEKLIHLKKYLTGDRMWGLNNLCKRQKRPLDIDDVLVDFLGQHPQWTAYTPSQLRNMIAATIADISKRNELEPPLDPLGGGGRGA